MVELGGVIGEYKGNEYQANWHNVEVIGWGIVRGSTRGRSTRDEEERTRS